MDAHHVSLSPQEPLVAVVTPVHNGARYLSECIESVLAQTYTNWRYVIADNCSTDGSAEIAEAYAARDPRVRVHRFTTFVTVVRSFNRAVSLLDREAVYGKLVLADDWLYPDYLERTVELAARHPSVGVVAGYRINGCEVDLDVLPAKTEVVPGKQVCHDHLVGGRYLLGTPTTVLFRADLLREREPEVFPELQLDGEDDEFVHYHADTDMCLALLEKSDLGFIHRVLSYSRVHDEGITVRWALAMGTWLPGHLLALLRYGPNTLSSDELEARARDVIRRYEWYLLRSSIRPRVLDARFREYHRAALARIRAQMPEAGLRGSLLLSTFAVLFGG